MKDGVAARTDGQGKMTLGTRRALLQLDPLTNVVFQTGPTSLDAVLGQGGTRVAIDPDQFGRSTFRLRAGGTTTYINIPVRMLTQPGPSPCPPTGTGLGDLLLFTVRLGSNGVYIGVPTGASTLGVTRGNNQLVSVEGGSEVDIPHDVNQQVAKRPINQQEEQAWQSTLAEWSSLQTLIVRPPHPETGNPLSGEFLIYWSQHGGLAQQGLPISGEFREVSPTDGKTYSVQYFERAVFEHHPEHTGTPHEVLLSLLGSFRYIEKYGTAGAPNQVPNRSPSSIAFPETGKRLGGKFLEYWQTHGGLAQQGYPISEEFRERNELDGNTYTVQYFERAVFELHPENKPPFDVLLSQLGTFRFRKLYTQPSGQAAVQSRHLYPLQVSTAQISTPTPNNCPDKPPTKPVPLNPRIGAQLVLTGGQGVALEWTRAYHARGVDYTLELQIEQPAGGGTWQPMVAQQGLTSTTTSAFNLPAGQYRWRVGAVGRNTTIATVSDWSPFSITPAGPLPAGCLDFQALQPQKFTGINFRLYPLEFTNPLAMTATQALPLELVDRGEDKDGKPELYVPFSLDTGGFKPMFVDFPLSGFPNGVKNVSIELQHFNSASVRALDGLGRVLDEVSQPNQRTRAALQAGGPSIRRLQFNVVETLIYKICWVP
ncbi:MAG TPA: hypothetical protein VF826_20560 [Chloroflexia bacterium]